MGSKGCTGSIKLNSVDKQQDKKSCTVNTSHIHNNLKCLYTNADQFFNKIFELKARINTFQPDIIAITEVKAKNPKTHYNLAEFTLHGYTMFSLNLSETAGRGIIIYTKENLKATEVTLTNTYSEILLVKITYNISKTLHFGCVYRSESGSEDNNLNLLKAIREVCELHGDMTVIVGNFNLPHINWENWSTGSDSPSSLSF